MGLSPPVNLSNAEEAAKLLSTETREAFVTPASLPVPQIHVPAVMQNNKVFHFTPIQSRFLAALMEKKSLDLAADAVGRSVQWCKDFMNEPNTIDYMNDIIEEEAIAKGLVPRWFFNQLYKVWNGQKKVSREQMEAIKAIGDRICPKVERVSHSFEDTEFEFVAEGKSHVE